ncbi:MAG: family 16 glycosylhydrolase [Bacteroides sp.]
MAIKYFLFILSLLVLSCTEKKATEKIEAPVPPNEGTEFLPTDADYRPTSKGTTVSVPNGYKLVWHDEFDEDGTPSAVWSYEEGFVRNEELQWYQSDNATVSNGCLVIEARRETVTNPYYDAGSNDWRKNRKEARYTSSCLTTQQSFHFRYGKLEVRAKIPAHTGAWPAIWTLGNQWIWPLNGEIDIMEYYIKNGRPSILANACWGSSQAWVAIWDESVVPFSQFTGQDSEWADKFHIWRMDWDTEWIRLYLDDVLMNEIDLSQTFNQGWQENRMNPFSNTVEGFGHYILLNLALGGNGGTPDENLLPFHYLIDYVRVFQLE